MEFFFPIFKCSLDCVKEKRDKNLDVFIFITKSLRKFLKKLFFMHFEIFGGYTKFIRLLIYAVNYRFYKITQIASKHLSALRDPKLEFYYANWSLQAFFDFIHFSIYLVHF